jgi:hypothetical protein
MLTFGTPETNAIRQADGSFVMGRCPIAWNGIEWGVLERISLESSDPPGGTVQCFQVKLWNGNSYSSTDKEDLLAYVAEVLTQETTVLQS